MLHVVRRSSLVLLSSLLLGSGSAAGQTSNATLQGTVSDPSGAVLPGVSVRLESAATGLQRDAVTNDAGLYGFNFLPSGRYSLDRPRRRPLA